MEPKELIVISSPPVAKMLMDTFRRNILYHCTFKEMSQKDLVFSLNSNYSRIQYHLNLLVESKIIHKVRTEVCGKKVQSFYRATAYNYHINFF